MEIASRKNSGVPWSDKKEWSQVGLFFERSLASVSPSSDIFIIQSTIKSYLFEVDTLLSGVCESICSQCKDVCCKKATVWYDFRDLVFLSLSMGAIPREQIRKDHCSICIHLSSHGCRLPRAERPFICTWYICPAFKLAIQSGIVAADTLNCIKNKLEVLQVERKKLEECFVKLVY